MATNGGENELQKYLRKKKRAEMYKKRKDLNTSDEYS